ncbi:MFS transporter [Tepidibacillus sp. HK-1]|uniref:MFS transporter n=1 Tax=Tepidibacillus sp. HK-1 TaxID=1883407 RepID=UPI0008537E68|nr:MFS transporter [Tepidibacillus sp. HK-1]GBF10134.1 putative multidrug-efflux transporter/MT1297 [Tepidibacillus sp. HK-1]
MELMRGLPVKKEWMNRSFGLLMVGRFISQLGDKLYLLALPWLVLELTHSALSSSITFALEIIPQVLLAPFIGVFVDRKSRKLLMVFSDWVRGIIVGVITMLAYLGNIQMIHIYLAAFLLATFTLLFDSASEGYIPKVVAKSYLVEANANLTFINTLMRLIGPALAGILIAWIGAAGTIGINAISFILSGMVLSFLNKDDDENSGNKKVNKILEDIREGFQYLTKHEILFPIALFSTFMNMGIFLVQALLIYGSKEILGYGPEETSIIFWVSGIVASITTLLLKPLKKIATKGKIVRFGSIGVFFSIFILVLNESLVTFTVSYTLLLMIGIIVNVNMMAYRQEIIPDHLFGRVMTSSRVLVNVFSPISMIAAGYLASKYSTQLVFEIAAVIIFCNVLYAWFSKMRQIE